tara:strand:- start:321 stop:1163 length:843 start_codon:yes stop_codon:yes gene_type:complete
MNKYLSLIRVKQWIKNLFCFSGIIFGPSTFSSYLFLQSFKTFLCFCLISSFVYVLNDIFDKESDSKHPKKKNRPIASGLINILPATLLAVLFLIIGLILAKNINDLVFYIIICYLINNFLYNIFFKNLIVIDVLSIALGFIFRLFSGIYSVGLMPSPWITLCTFFLALFLGFAKRRAELKKSNGNYFTRAVLKKYKINFLDSLINDAAFGSIISYSLFCSVNQKNVGIMTTIPIVYFAIMHYKNLLFQNIHGEEPESVVLEDKILLASIFLWLFLYILFK